MIYINFIVKFESMVTMQYRKVEEIAKLQGNPRKIQESEVKRLMVSIQRLPDYFEAHPIVLSDRTGKLVVIDGNQRLEASKRLGLKEVPTALMSGLTEEREKEIILRANVLNGEWDLEALQEWDKTLLEESGLPEETWKEGNEDIPSTGAKGSLAEKFGIIPFSVLDTRLFSTVQRY